MGYFHSTRRSKRKHGWPDYQPALALLPSSSSLSTHRKELAGPETTLSNLLTFAYFDWRLGGSRKGKEGEEEEQERVGRRGEQAKLHHSGRCTSVFECFFHRIEAFRAQKPTFLIVINPPSTIGEEIISSHRAGFRCYGRAKGSRHYTLLFARLFPRFISYTITELWKSLLFS
jgi:hypothetical protein